MIEVREEISVWPKGLLEQTEPERRYKESPDLGKITRSYLTTEDIISWNIQKLESFIPEKELRFEIQGLALAVATYKLKNMRGYNYSERQKISDGLIEAKYFSNILKGINRTLNIKRKTPKEIMGILQIVLYPLLFNDKNIEKKFTDINANQKVYYSVSRIMKKSQDDDDLTEGLIRLGKELENIKSGTTVKNIETELSKHKKTQKEIIKAIKTRMVAGKLVEESESIRRNLSNGLTDKFK
jgi:hypothetical protein